MNKQRRNAITELYNQLDNISNQVNILLGEEEEYYDNIPENLQQSDKGWKSEEASLALADAVDALNSVKDFLDQAREQ